MVTQYTLRKLFPFFLLLAFVIVNCVIGWFSDSGKIIKETKVKRVDDFENIIFLETSDEQKLSAKDVCAVESAVRSHTDKTIYLYMTKKKDDDKMYSVLKSFNNLNLRTIYLEEYVAGTPFESIIPLLTVSKWKVTHTSDVLRLLALYYLGGIYLDIDVIVLKRLDDLGTNFIGFESPGAIGTNVIGMANHGVGKRFLEEAIRNLSETYNGNEFLDNGPKLVEKILKNFCSTNIVADMNNITCPGFQIYPEEYFNPFHYARSLSLLYDRRTRIEITNPNTRVIHFWGSLTRDYTITYNSLYKRLMYRYCPQTYSVALDSMGSASLMYSKILKYYKNKIQ